MFKRRSDEREGKYSPVVFAIIRVYIYRACGGVLCFVGVNRNGNNTRCIAGARERERDIERPEALRWDQYRALQKYGKRGKAGSKREQTDKKVVGKREEREKMERKERPAASLFRGIPNPV